jgi:hypothetical protein
MERISDTNDTAPPTASSRHLFRWVVLTVLTVIVLANWRLVAATIAVVAVLSIVVATFMVVALIRKATRPIGQLSLIDVALVTWLYRRWEVWRTPRQASGTSNITNIRPR